MLSLDRFAQLLEEAAGSLPSEIFNELNLGVGLVEQDKMKTGTASGRPAYILGEYSSSRSMGRGILLYYGSFAKVYPELSDNEEGRRVISEVLRHELLHHLESQAGARDLEIADAKRLMEL